MIGPSSTRKQQSGTGMDTQTETKQAAYDTTRARLLELIDHPVTTVSVNEYRAMLNAAQRAHDIAFNELHPNLAHG